MNKTMSTAARALAICAAAAIGHSAAAAGLATDQTVAGALRTYVVRFHDLDVSRMEGAAALYSRIHHAAVVVCEPSVSRDVGNYAMYRACMDKAVADAVEHVNRPLLSQYHQLRIKGDKAGLVRLAKAN
jgi:UrcA family protein